MRQTAEEESLEDAPLFRKQYLREKFVQQRFYGWYYT